VTTVLTALDTDPAQLDEHEKRFTEKIREYGWRGTNVFAEDDLPGFAFTTGLWLTLRTAEIIVFSLEEDASNQIFWNIFNDAKGGREFRSHQRLANVLERYDVVLLPVAKRHYREHLGWSSWFYRGDGFPCLQLIWPDRNNAFPWQGGFEREFENDQPDLSEGGWDNVQLLE
jgi:hypothetical protein